MVRDLLETVPVAILLTAILSYGATRTATNSAPQRTMPREAPEIEARYASVSDWQAALVPSKKSPAPSSLLTSETPVTDPPTDEQTLEAELFIAVKPSSHAVAYFNSADISRFIRRPASRHSGSPVSTEKKAPLASGRPMIVINTATLEELMQIPGIGPSKAGLILSHRPASGFGAWTEIDLVPGIGTQTLQMLQLHATLN